MKLSVLVFCFGWMLISTVGTAKSNEDRHTEVALRMIGHQVLLQSGDSSSRVLPLVRENGAYRIQFESPFSFEPSELVATINAVVLKNQVAESFVVEVQNCDDQAVVYSYEITDVEHPDLIPCKGRAIDRACYELLLIFPTKDTEAAVLDSSKSSSDDSNSRNLFYLVLIIGAIILTFFLFRKRRTRNLPASEQEHMVPLGNYVFDTINTELHYQNERIVLTGKEAELLKVLYESPNTTVEKEVILNKVWGDDGDYVGRTLDVFISRLRKKLSADPQLKIINIRGVGYKLVTVPS
jgi:hypothetical protein